MKVNYMAILWDFTIVCDAIWIRDRHPGRFRDGTKIVPSSRRDGTGQVKDPAGRDGTGQKFSGTGRDDFKIIFRGTGRLLFWTGRDRDGTTFISTGRCGTTLFVRDGSRMSEEFTPYYHPSSKFSKN